MHVPIRLREANSAQAEGLSPQEIDEKVAEILRQCLDTHGGQFDPSAISHKTAGLKSEDERLYARLNKLLAPGQLSSFVDKRPEFAWMPRNPAQKRPGMIITWATASGSANAGHAQDDQGTEWSGWSGCGGRSDSSGWKHRSGCSWWTEQPASGGEASSGRFAPGSANAWGGGDWWSQSRASGGVAPGSASAMCDQTDGDQ